MPDRVAEIPTGQHIQIGAIVFPRMDQVDLTGPYSVLSRLPNSSFQRLWKDTKPGLALLPALRPRLFVAVHGPGRLCPGSEGCGQPPGSGVDAPLRRVAEKHPDLPASRTGSVSDGRTVRTVAAG
jgi:hypothetical protein